MLQGKRGELRNLFSVQQTDALEAWARTLIGAPPSSFLITQTMSQTVATGWQFLNLDWPVYDLAGVWDASAQQLILPLGSIWDLRLYISSDTLIAGAQSNELFLADGSLTVAGPGGRAIDFGYQTRPAGLFSPCFGNARHWQQLENSPKSLRAVVRFSTGTAVPTIPGQGFTALSGTRIA